MVEATSVGKLEPFKCFYIGVHHMTIMKISTCTLEIKFISLMLINVLTSCVMTLCSDVI